MTGDKVVRKNAMEVMGEKSRCANGEDLILSFRGIKETQMSEGGVSEEQASRVKGLAKLNLHRV